MADIGQNIPNANQ